MDTRFLKILYIALTVLLMLAIYWAVDTFGVSDLIVNIEALTIRVRAYGNIGPLLIIGLMVLAVVFNPLPSAPIALAAGAVYGHTWGTIYIITGALSGATIAFLIARLAGYSYVQRIVRSSKLSLGRLGSQNSLMAIIFVSRLLPFLSFDLISYAAGLTSITLWRFMLATLFGLIPASFLLAHFGGEMVGADMHKMTIFILIAGLITLLPLAYKMLRKYRSTDLEAPE